MKFYKIFLSLFVVFALLFGLAEPLISTSDSINQKVFRLHILANSDSNTDQSIKLKVRDYVLNFTSNMFDGDTLEENIQIAEKNSSFIEKSINDYIKQIGYDYQSTVTVCKEYFKTRVYDDFSLPAGEYNSLKIELGKGEGHNWWCIIFPQVCLSGCTQAMDEYLSDEEMDLITNGYTPKFKIVEIYNDLKQKINETF